MNEIQSGDQVTVKCTGTLQDGTVFYQGGDEPLTFEAGTKDVIPAVSESVVGMKPGETKKVTAQPEQAYGERNPDLVIDVPNEKLPEEVQIGQALELDMGGRKLPAVVVAKDDQNARIDANHPLAGQVLNFEIEVVPAT